jgi:hypothetical protein
VAASLDERIRKGLDFVARVNIAVDGAGRLLDLAIGNNDFTLFAVDQLDFVVENTPFPASVTSGQYNTLSGQTGSKQDFADTLQQMIIALVTAVGSAEETLLGSVQSQAARDLGVIPFSTACNCVYDDGKTTTTTPFACVEGLAGKCQPASIVGGGKK